MDNPGPNEGQLMEPAAQAAPEGSTCAPATPPAPPPAKKTGGKAVQKTAPRRRRGGRELTDPQNRFLAHALVLEEAGTPRYFRTIILTLAGLVICFLIWAGITPVPEVARAPGAVTPAGSVKVIQHLEGGIARTILVRDGSLVKPGDVLIRLDPAQSRSELRLLRVQEAFLVFKAARLKALADDATPPRPSTRDLRKYRRLYRDQMRVLRLQQDSFNKRRAVLSQRIKQKKSVQVVLKRREQSIRRRLKSAEEQFRIRERLFKKGILSRSKYLEASREVERVRGELDGVLARQGMGVNELAEAEAQLTEMEAKVRSEAIAERGKTVGELAQVREKIKKLEDRVDRLDIRSPAKGYVKGLVVTTRGGVIRPGERIMEIVPVERELVAEVRISTRDIGHVKVGQPAKVKVDTYDFSRYGVINGKLTKISATTFQDERTKVPFYKGTIRLDRFSLGRTARENPILAGMTVQGEIITGSKTVLAYLLSKPLQAVKSAFQER